MAHYAKVEDGKVTNVIVADADFISGLADKDKWVQTSYNTYGGKHYEPDTDPPKKYISKDKKPLRKNYAGIGFTYDKDKDAFIPPTPNPSWKLNPDSCLWEPPVKYPTDGKHYYWDETSTSWKEATGDGSVPPEP